MLDEDVDHEWHITGNLSPKVVLELKYVQSRSRLSEAGLT